MASERAKEAVGRAAARLVCSGMRVGLGTGSTAFFLVQALGEAWARGELHDVRFVATSEQTARQARSLGLPVGSLEEVQTLDLTIDGADEVDPSLTLIKGRGGALLREKIVAAASARMVVITDDSKLVDHLGTSMPLPVEIEPFGYTTTLRALELLGCETVLRTVAPTGGAGAGQSLEGDLAGPPAPSLYRTDGGHFIADCRFARIDDAAALQTAINLIPGCIESGLFVGMAQEVYIGRDDQVLVATPDALINPWQVRGTP